MQKNKRLRAFGDAIQDINKLTGYSSRSIMLLSFQNETSLTQLCQLGKHITKNEKQITILGNIIRKICTDNYEQNIYCLHLSWVLDRKKFQQSTDDFIKNLHYLYFFFELLEETEMTVYLCLSRSKKNFEEIQRLHNILGSKNYGTIILQQRKTDLSNMRQISIDNPKEIPREISFTNFCIETNRLNELFSLSYLQNRQKLYYSLQNLKSSIQDHLLSFLNVAKNLMQIFLSSQNKSLKQKLNCFSIKHIIGNPRQPLIQNSDCYLPVLEDKDQQIRMREYYFLFRFLDMYRIYKQTPDSMKNGEKFIKEVFRALKILSVKIEQRVDNIIEEINNLRDHIRKLQKMLGSEIPSYLNKNIVGYCQKWVPNKSKFIKILAKMKIVPNLSTTYYSNLQTVFSISFSKQDFQTNQIYQQVKIDIESQQLILKLAKNKTIMLSFYHRSPNELCSAIRQNLQICQYQDFKNFRQINYKVVILKDTAQCLMNINKPKLALEIYQKIKFYSKVQACIKEILLESSQDEQKILLIQTSKYFRGVSEYQLSRKYAQKVYEMDPTQMNFIIENKTEYLIGDRSLDQQTKLKEMHLFVNMTLSSMFWSQISKLDQTIKTQHKLEAKIKNPTFIQIAKNLKKSLQASKL